MIGEVCHFVDYLQCVSGANPTEVFARAISGSLGKYRSDDNVAITVSMDDGSVGTIMYSALGTKTYSRERVELFWDESAAVIEDFRLLEFARGSKKEHKKLSGQDMGYRKEIADFIHGSASDSQTNFERAAVTTLTTFAILDSLKKRRPVTVQKLKRGR